LLIILSLDNQKIPSFLDTPDILSKLLTRQFTRAEIKTTDVARIEEKQQPRRSKHNILNVQSQSSDIDSECNGIDGEEIRLEWISFVTCCY